MVGWHHRLNGHEFEWTQRVDVGQDIWHAAVHGVSKSRTRLERLNWTVIILPSAFISVFLNLTTVLKVSTIVLSWQIRWVTKAQISCGLTKDQGQTVVQGLERAWPIGWDTTLSSAIHLAVLYRLQIHRLLPLSPELRSAVLSSEKASCLLGKVNLLLFYSDYMYIFHLCSTSIFSDVVS